MPETNDTSTENKMEGSEGGTAKESFKDLMKEIASAALSAVGKIVHEKYKHERVDGKPRTNTE